MNTTFVLIHSPLVGPLTWSRVARVLNRHGYSVSVPHLVDSDDVPLPYWEQEAAAAARYISEIPLDAPLVLVAHSGAGPLLPAIHQAIRHDVHSYIFVDAGLPLDGCTRLELMALEPQERAQKFRKHLEAGGTFLNWRDGDFHEIVPDTRIRRAVLSELKPRRLGFFDERIPAFPGWDKAPCGYIRFSQGYIIQFKQARENGWRVMEIPGGHFHMLVKPRLVADAIIEMTAQLTSPEKE